MPTNKEMQTQVNIKITDCEKWFADVILVITTMN